MNVRMKKSSKGINFDKIVNDSYIESKDINKK